MKASVKRAYTDRITGEIHLKGETVELTAERADELARGGFVEAAAQETGEPKAAPRKRAPRKAAK